MTTSQFRLPPQAYEAIRGLDRFIATTGVSKELVALVKLRVSQINGCSYCVDLHCKEARAEGTSERKLHGVVVWHETPFFDDLERIAFELAESVTLLPPREAHGTVEKFGGALSGDVLSGILMTAISINAWNRVGVPLGMSPTREG